MVAALTGRATAPPRRTPPRALHTCGLLAALLFHPRAAGGQPLEAQPQPVQPEGATVVLWSAECTSEAPDASAVVELLRVELAPAPVVLQTRPTPSRADGTLWLQQCGEVPRIAILRAGARSAEREVDLADVPVSMHARTLAMALAELRRDAAHRGQDRPRPVETAAARSHPPPASPAPSGIAGHAGIVVRDAVRTGTWLVGPELGVDLGALRLGASGLWHRSDHALGALTLMSVTALAGWQVFRTGEAAAFGLRARAELGASWGLAEPLDGKVGRDQRALQANVLARMFGSMPLSDGVQAELGLELGYARGLIARSNGRESESTHGPSIGIALALVHDL